MNRRSATRAVRRAARAELAERPKLLVVEDEKALRLAIARGAIDRFEVTATPDGNAAAELLTKHHYDVVLTDLGLPGMSGLDLLRVARTYDLDVPVIVMTGQPTLSTAIDALELGVLSYLEKPFSLDTLREQLERAAKLSRLARARREASAVVGSSLAGDRAGLHTSLDRALEGLHIVYQPIIDRRRRRPYGWEALMRSREPALPHPGAVLECAERLGRLREVGRRVRELAAASFHPPDDDQRLFVNLHPADLQDLDLYDADASLTRIASNVVLEITERAALDAVADTMMRARELRARGFSLALDDLGAGYAGLTSFATLEPDIIKLDMSLIRGIDASPLKQRLVAAMIVLCSDLGMRVVGEGIETAGELGVLVGLGCDLLQGFLLGRPGPGLVAAVPPAW